MPILLVRHSETEWNRKGLFQGSQDSPLTSQGHKQNISLLTNIKQYRVRHIISSDCKRAQTTAKAIYNKILCTYIEISLLKERYFGDAEGLNVRQILNKWPCATSSERENWIDFDKIPVAEKKIDFSKRIQAAASLLLLNS